MTVAEVAKESLWLTTFVRELGIEQGVVQLHCDSHGAIYLPKHIDVRTKHIDVRFHKIRELLAANKILLQKVHTENIVDMMT